jgi:hypothetical protein
MEKELKKQLKLFASIFKDAQDKGKREADVVMYVVQFFKDVLGYDVFTEISKEFQIKEKYCDIAIKLDGQVEFLIEVKQPGMRLMDRHIEQAENYAMRSGTKWVLLTNGCEWRVFHLSFDEEGGVESTLAFRIDLLKDFLDNPDDVISKFNMLHKKYYLKGELEKYWTKKTMLVPKSLASALFTNTVLRAISKEINRGADVKVGTEEIGKALKNIFDKEILAEMADIKIGKKRRTRRAKKEPGEKVPKLPETTEISAKGEDSTKEEGNE